MKKIKTKSQLEDIWKQAQGKTNPAIGKSKFVTPAIRLVEKNEMSVLQKINDVVSGKFKKEAIARIPTFVSFDGRERPLIFSSETSKKVNQHGEIIPDNLLFTANDWDYAIKNIDGNKDKINLIKQIPNSDNFLVIGANRDNGYFIVTHFEYVSKTGKELKNLLKKRGDVLDRLGRTPESTTPQ